MNEVSILNLQSGFRKSLLDMSDWRSHILEYIEGYTLAFSEHYTDAQIGCIQCLQAADGRKELSASLRSQGKEKVQGVWSVAWRPQGRVQDF